MIRMTAPTRRETLAALGGVTVGLAGCSATRQCGGDSAPEDLLSVNITDIRTTQAGFSGDVIVSNRDAHHDHTRYEDVAFYAYDQRSERVLKLPLGDLGPGDEWTSVVEFDRFPFVITADAERYESSPPNECWRPQAGAEIRGYVGHYEPGDRLPTRSSGHVWDLLEERSVGQDAEHDFERNRLPLGPIHARITRCRVRNFDRNRRFHPPDLSVLPDPSWLDDPIAPPYRSTTVEVAYRGPADVDTSTPRDYRPASVECSDAPNRLQEAIVADGVGRVTEPEFYSLLGALEGRSVDGVRELPPCTRRHVECADTRWSNCMTGEDAWSQGTLTFRAWYAIRCDGERHVFRFRLVDDWRS